MSTHLSHRSLSRLISRLDQYASTYQLIQKLFAEDSAGTLSNFDSKGSFRSTAFIDKAPLDRVPPLGASSLFTRGSDTISTSLVSKNILAVRRMDSTLGTYGADPDGYKDSVYLSELSTFCLQEYNWLRNQTYQVWSRSAAIPSQVVGISFEVHNGKGFQSIPVVTSTIVGHKFGEFVQTRKATIHKKKN